MKKILTVLLPLSLLLSVSCSKEYADKPNNDPQIKLNAEVINAKTKAAPVYGPINSTFSTDFPVGIYAKNGAWVAGPSASLILVNNDATVAAAGSHDITFTGGPYYYPSDGSTVDFYAYAPHATELTASGAGTSPVVEITIDGHEDVMWATATGSKAGSAAATNPVVNFAHKLTQLQFTFTSGTGYPASGNKVVSLLVKNQPTKVDMTIQSGTCSFSGSADMQALSTANQTAGIDIVTAGTDAASPIMTQPKTGANAYLLDIVVKPASGGSNVTYSNVPVTVTAVEGSAHMITITFSGTAITATATVANWLTGSSGTATAQ